MDFRRGATEEIGSFEQWLRCCLQFFGHGNPMNAITSTSYTEAWRRMRQGMPKPKAILSISAHWFVPEIGITAPRTIHDFGRFLPELYQIKYPAPGEPTGASRPGASNKEVLIDDRI